MAEKYQQLKDSSPSKFIIDKKKFKNNFKFQPLGTLQMQNRLSIIFFILYEQKWYTKYICIEKERKRI